MSKIILSEDTWNTLLAESSDQDCARRGSDDRHDACVGRSGIRENI